MGDIEISPGVSRLAITWSKGTVRAICVLVVQLSLITCNGELKQDSDARESLLRDGGTEKRLYQQRQRREE